MKQKKATQVFMNHPAINGDFAKASEILGYSEQVIRRWNSRRNDVDMPVSLIPDASQAMGITPREFAVLLWGS